MDQHSSLPATPESASASSALPNVPATWPGAFGLYKYSKAAVQRNFTTILFLYILNLVFASGLGFVLGKDGRLIGDLASIVISLASYVAYLASARGQTTDIEAVFKKAFSPLFVNYFFMVLLTVVIAIISLLLLIVPFFIVLPRLVLGGYFVVDKDLGPVDALKASWEATQGHAGKVWGVIGASLAMVLLIFTIIGIPFGIYFLFMYSDAFALLYEFLGLHPADSKPSATTASAPAA